MITYIINWYRAMRAIRILNKRTNKTLMTWPGRAKKDRFKTFHGPPPDWRL